MQKFRACKGVLIFVVALVLSCIGCYSVVQGSNGTTDVYTLIDDGVESTIVSESDNVSQMLSDNGITLNAQDKLDISKLETDNVIEIKRCKTVYVEDNSNIASYDVYSCTVKSVLSELNINTKGKSITPSFETTIKDGLVISLSDIYDLEIILNGENQTVTAYSGQTYKDVLGGLSVSLADNDYVSVDIESEIMPDTLSVIVKQAITETVTKTEDIAYDTEVKYSSSLSAGEQKIAQEGKTGTKEIVTEVISYYDGTVISETEISETITVESQTKIIEIGTKVNNSKTEYENLYIGQVISGKKTHYCCCSECCGTSSSGITASGLKVYTGMDNPYIIACNWLPIGAVVDIDGIIYTVQDRGGSDFDTVGRVDIFVPEGHSTALAKGTGSCTITILSF